MGPDPSLPWSCQFQVGVKITSPRCMLIRFPWTAVKPPLPSIIKRMANAVWRCAGAVSFGITSCKPAYIVSVVNGASGNGQYIGSNAKRGSLLDLPLAGFTNIKTLRSACFSVINSPARSSDGLISSYRHTWGMDFGLGSGGFSLFICAQRGFV